MDPITLFHMGGPFMWPILALLLLALSLAVERLIYYAYTYSAPGEPQDFCPDGHLRPPKPTSWLDRSLPAAEARFHRFAPVRLIESVSSQSPGRPPDAILQRTGNALSEELSRRLSVLPIVSSVAPMIGLLGTVAGMMDSFQAIAASGGQASMGELADGIWVAMTTTAFGLMTGIPAYLFHGAFLSIVNRRIALMNRTAHYLEEVGLVQPSRDSEAA
ncbi:MAG: MotA/TolQ/ExbB proton channel family protein [Leptospiraceae bacterium]|nr:MotA/TolQ/ExbB proton channel family protein [Leptospiraceae bacterium]